MADATIDWDDQQGEFLPIKCLDLGDGTYALAVRGAPVSGAFVNISTNTTTVVLSGAGVLERVVCGLPNSSAVMTLYDNTSGSGTVIGAITVPTGLLSADQVPFDLAFGAVVSTGITAVTTGSGQWTVVYRAD